MDAHEHQRMAEHEEWYWWHLARKAIVHRLIRRHAPASPRILDVGCGTGATTASLLCFGPVIGLDIGEAALRRARQRNLTVTRSNAVHLPLRNESFDVVVALDVFEHLDDDVAAIRSIRNTLAPDGVLIATVPAYEFLWSSHDIALGHKRRYVRGRLIQALEAGGLKVEVCSYVMAAILPVAAVIRLADRILPGRSAQRQSDYPAVPTFLNTLLTHVSAFDGRLIEWFNLPFGLSVLAVARRTD